jgi:hypothetical protein
MGPKLRCVDFCAASGHDGEVSRVKAVGRQWDGWEPGVHGRCPQHVRNFEMTIHCAVYLSLSLSLHMPHTL